MHQFEKILKKNRKYYKAIISKAIILKELDRKEELSKCFEEFLKVYDELSKDENEYIHLIRHKCYFYTLMDKDNEAHRCYEDCLRL